MYCPTVINYAAPANHCHEEVASNWSATCTSADGGACRETERLRTARAFSLWREHEMRCAILNDTIALLSKPCAAEAEATHSTA